MDHLALVVRWGEDVTLPERKRTALYGRQQRSVPTLSVFLVSDTHIDSPFPERRPKDARSIAWLNLLAVELHNGGNFPTFLHLFLPLDVIAFYLIRGGSFHLLTTERYVNILAIVSESSVRILHPTTGTNGVNLLSGL